LQRSTAHHSPRAVWPPRTHARGDVGVSAARLFERVGENGKAGGVEGAGGLDTLVVGGLRQRRHCGLSPSKVENDGAEGVAEDVAEEVGMCGTLVTASILFASIDSPYSVFGRMQDIEGSIALLGIIGEEVHM